MSEELEITLEELSTWRYDEYEFVDIRDEGAIAYGKIPGAKEIPFNELENNLEQFDIGKKQIVYCAKGMISKDAAIQLRERGYSAYSLFGGYYAFLTKKMNEDQKNEVDRLEHIEKSIQKKFHKQLFAKFVKAINTYELVKEGDHIAVCISGGKDSMLMAKLFQELKKHNKFDFDLTFLVMDPGYSWENRQVIKKMRDY